MNSDNSYNILFLTCWYPLEENPNFGVYVREHAKAIQETGNRVAVGRIWAMPSQKLYDVKRFIHDDGGLQTAEVIIYSRFYKLFRAWWTLLYLLLWPYLRKNVLPDFQPDLVHSNVLYPAGFIGHQVAKKLNLPHHHTEHWSKTGSFLNSSPWRKRGRRLVSDAAAIHPVSRFLAESFTPFLQDRNKIQVIPNVVDGELFSYSPKESSTDKIDLLCVMNFRDKKIPDKKPEVLIEALEKLPKNLQNKFRLSFIGPNQEGSAVQQMWNRSEIATEVIFDGLQPKSYVAKKMNEADFLVHPSQMETFGVVVAEALQCGLPCIATDLPALRELIGEKEGKLVKQNEVLDWEEAFQWAAAHKNSFDHAAIARKNSDRFTPQTIGKKYTEAYHQTLATS